MRDANIGEYGLAAAALAIAILVYMASCGTARAAEHEIRFRNADPTQSYTQLRTEWGTMTVSCAPGATCAVVVDLPVGRHEIVAQAASGAAWSADSNVLEALVFPPPVECLAIPACRFDADRDGVVTGTDFTRFVATFGASWAP